MEVLFDFNEFLMPAARSFARLRDRAFSSIQVRCSASQLRLMSIRTADGVADPSGSFRPFGVTPRVGARWIIGSSEVFAKPQQNVSIQVTWAEVYDKEGFFRKKDPVDYTVDFDFLNAGAWRSDVAGSRRSYRGSFAGIGLIAIAESRADAEFLASPSGIGDAGPIANVELSGRWTRDRAVSVSDLGFEERVATIVVDNPGYGASDAELLLYEPKYGADSITGFMRITLNQDFGHDDYLDHKTRLLIAESKAQEESEGPVAGELTGKFRAAEPVRNIKRTDDYNYDGALRPSRIRRKLKRSS